ncbi:HARE-HTH domain-containing protein, partial [Haematococcus lacustris]
MSCARRSVGIEVGRGDATQPHDTEKNRGSRRGDVNRHVPYIAWEWTELHCLILGRRLNVLVLQKSSSTRPTSCPNNEDTHCYCSTRPVSLRQLCRGLLTQSPDEGAQPSSLKLACLPAERIIVAGSCLAKAHAREPPSEYLDLFKRQSRALPNMSRTDLGDSDWQGPVWWPDNDSPRRSDGSWPLSEASRLKGPPMNSCYTNYGVLKFKIWKGELYAYGTSFTRAAHWTNRMYRNYLVEQLLAVMWLYKDFPDELDIFYCWWDTPCLCDLKVPFIQYGMFGNDTMRYHAPSHRLSSRAVPQPAGQELVAPSTSQPKGVSTRRA